MISQQRNRKIPDWKFSLLLVVAIVLVITLYHFARQRTPVAPMQGESINSIAGNNTAAWSEPNANQIRVATYNIQRGKDISGNRDLSQTAEVIGKVDIAGLNEVRGPFFLDQRNQAEQLGRKLGMGWLFAPIQFEWFKVYLGNALLSKFPIDSWSTRPLLTQYHATDQVSSGKFRNLIKAELSINGNKVVLLITHLDRGAIRQYQLKDVLSEFTRYDRAILIGDLNTNRNDPQLAELLSSGDALDSIHQAIGDADVGYRIDWIITRGFDVVDGGSTPAGVSDHPFYWVDLRISK